MLSALNKPGVNISTVEDPVEYTLDGIHQVQVIREKGLDFSRALRSHETRSRYYSRWRN